MIGAKFETSLVENHAPFLNSKTEMNTFIFGCTNGAHIHSCIAIDRQNKENAFKYFVEQIANNINQVLREYPPPPPALRFVLEWIHC